MSDGVTVRIALSAIAFEAGTQIRDAIDPHVVTEYAEAMMGGAQFPPIVLFHDGSQHYLADGFHRFLAAQRNTCTDIEADVRPGTKEDALWFALGANRQHGKQLTAADKKHAIALALQTWGKGGRTQADIARQLGIAESTLSYHATRLSDIGRLQRPTSVVDRDGRTLPVPARSRNAIGDRRDDIVERLKRGEPPGVIATAVHIHRNKVFAIKRELGLSKGPDRSPVARDARFARMREMAVEGHTSRQIAAAVGLSESGCRVTLRKAGIEIPADRAVGKIKRHDSNRIVASIVMDAENLTEGVRLIEFNGLDRSRLAGWLRSLTTSRDSLGVFIRRLMKEQQHGEAADPEAVQDSTRPHRSDAHSAGSRHAARVS